MLREEIKNKVEEVKGTENGTELLTFMLDKGYAMEDWQDLENAEQSAIDSLEEFFGTDVAVGLLVSNGTPLQNGGELTAEEMRNIKNQSKKNKNNQQNTENQPKEETKSVKMKKYKTIDNLITLTEVKETTFGNVEQINENMFGMYIKGGELAKLFLEGNLVYDPTMQRGIKEDKGGIERAVFREGHIKDIYNSMKEGTFTPTQIHFAIITDDNTNESEYDSDNKELAVNGKIRLLDGQHRTRAIVKLYMEIQTGKISNVNIDDFVFNVAVHVVTSEQARTIYANIDKNLKLDKSQSRQLQCDAYANIINFLNINGESDLRGKIAVARPVGKRMVLFNTLTQALENNIEINSIKERDEIKMYLNEFFNYLTSKLPQAFGSEDARMEFRKDNLLNENNFFNALIKVAFVDREAYQENIDTIAENVDFFRKDNPIWMQYNAVKHKVGKEKGFAMQNTNTGIKALSDRTLELLGYKEEQEGDAIQSE